MAGYEHSLFLILLLGFLLSEFHNRRKFSVYLLVGGILLTLLPPLVRIKVPWELILGLVLPWILWQRGYNWLQISWNLPKREVYLWMAYVLCLGLIFHFVGDSLWLRSAFFSIVASSMFWYLSRQSEQSNLLEVIGYLTLIILLIETSIPLNAPSLYFGSLFSGAGIGVILAIISIAVMKKISAAYSKWTLLALVYLAYWLAYVMKASPIAASLISVIVFTEFYLIRKESIEGSKIIIQFDRGIPFYFLLTLFVFTAWQTHQPIALVQWYEVILGLLAGLLVGYLGQRIRVPRFERRTIDWNNLLKLGIFLFGVLLLLPRETDLGPVMILVALGIAAFLPVLSMILLAVLRDLTTQQPGNYSDEL